MSTTESPQPATVEPERVHPIIPLEDPLRAFCTYAGGEEPYDMRDGLAQKLWSVVNFEFGPNVADALVTKLMRAVEQHITKTGRA